MYIVQTSPCSGNNDKQRRLRRLMQIISVFPNQLKIKLKINKTVSNGD